MDKELLARKRGAWSYIDSKAQDPAAELLNLGSAKVILATVTNGNAMSAVLGGLSVNGKLIILGAAAEPLEVPAMALIMGRRSIMGWPSGSSSAVGEGSIAISLLPELGELQILSQFSSGFTKPSSGASTDCFIHRIATEAGPKGPLKQLLPRA